MLNIKIRIVGLSNTLLRILSNPIFSSVGWIIAILCAFWAYYFYSDTRTPELCYLIKPIRAVIVRSEYNSKVNVYYENNILKSDLTAAQITIWNNGKGVIRQEDIRDKITIQTENNTPILEATIVKTTREVVHVDLDTGHLSDGIVGINWNTLEQDDGVTIQIIYQGNPELPISASGIIQGQKQIKRLEVPEKTIYRREFNRPLRKALEAQMLFSIVMGIIMMIFFAFQIYWSSNLWSRLRWGALILIFVICIWVVTRGLFYEYVEPPFGF
jgi:hypothetical protein